MRRQHGVITRGQLLAFGYSTKAIRCRLGDARLHPVHRGVYAVGRPELTQEGRWIAAVLTCGRGAVLSHGSAAALWGMRAVRPEPIHVSVPVPSPRCAEGVVVHRRHVLSAGDVAEHRRIPVTSPTCTLIDIAAQVSPGALAAAIGEADRLDLVDPERLRLALDETKPRRGLRALREILDRGTFRLTRSELERRFLALIREAGFPMPETNTRVNGFEVDFYWPELRLVVETDGIRYHRTSTQQQRDRVRDQAHTAAGLTTLRFTNAQVRYEPDHVRRILAATAAAATR